MTVTASKQRAWTAVCRYAELIPGRGVAALLDGRASGGVPHRRRAAVRGRQPRPVHSGAYVISRGITGSRDGAPTVASPMYKHVFDLGTGTCLDDRRRAADVPGAAVPRPGLGAAPGRMATIGNAKSARAVS